VLELCHPKSLEQALLQSLNTGLPLGLVLVGMGAISTSLLHSTLLASKNDSRSGLGSRRNHSSFAVARLRGISLEQSMTEQGIKASGFKLPFGIGELFVLADL